MDETIRSERLQYQHTGHWYLALAGLCMIVFLMEMSIPGARWYSEEAFRRIGMRPSAAATTLYCLALVPSSVLLVRAARRYWRMQEYFLRFQMVMGGIVLFHVMFLSVALDPVVLLLGVMVFANFALICRVRAPRTNPAS